MKLELKEITLDGIAYIAKSDALSYQKSFDKNGMKYCIVRTSTAGVFAGWVESRNGQEVKIREARRIYYWEGAGSLSQLASYGTSKPDKCKFPAPVDNILVLEAIEILECTIKSQESIMAVDEWIV